MEQASFDDMLGIDIGPSVEEVAAKQAAKILKLWSVKPAKSKKSVTDAHVVVTHAILRGVDEEELKYVFSHPKPLLSSVKKITDVILENALNEVNNYRKVSHQGKTIFEAWYTQYYVNRYTQSPGHIIKCIKNALFSGVQDTDIIMAMNILGKSQQVITEPSLQYALSRVRKMNQNKLNAGARAHEVDQATESEIFAARKFSFDKNEVFTSGGFFDYEEDIDD